MVSDSFWGEDDEDGQRWVGELVDEEDGVVLPLVVLGLIRGGVESTSSSIQILPELR